MSIKKLRRSFTATLRKFLGRRYYCDYIKETHVKWWGEGCQVYCKQGLSKCIDTLQPDNNNNWQCCPFWQRKLTNKMQARDFVIRNNVPVPELYWYGKNVDDIPFDKLPASYVIKTSFGASSEQVIPICNGRNIFNNQEYSPEQIREFFRGTMSRVAPYGYLMVEELLLPEEGGAQSKDHKCHVFAGKVAFIEVIDRIKGVATWYLRDWSLPPQSIGTGKFQQGPYEEPPAHYQKLLEYAEKLGGAYGPEYVRIDFYLTNRGCVFGEFTATPNQGLGQTTYGDRILGKLWKDMLRARA